MIIKKIKLNNIRSYENAEIEFPEGSVVLAGDIGSGKTSVLLAIEFALFGLQPGQKGSSLLRNNAKQGSVSLELEIDGKDIIIERGLKRGKSVAQTRANIEVDSKKLEVSVTELKNKVLELINYPKEFSRKTNLLYRFTVYTPQEEMKQIILEAPETRLNTLRHIFGIDKYKRIRENTQLFTTKLREKIKAYEGEIKNLEDIKNNLKQKKSEIQRLEKDLKITEKELEKKRKERADKESELKKIEDKLREKEKYEKEIEKTEVMLTGKQEFLLNLNKEKKILESEIHEAQKISFNQTEFDNLLLQIQEKEKQAEELNALYLEIMGKINALNSKITESINLRNQLSKLKLCPTCFQNVPEEYKANIIRKSEQEEEKSKKQIEELEIEKKGVVKKIEIIKSELAELKRKEDKCKLLKIKLASINEKKSKLNDLEKQKFSTEKDIALLKKQILTLKQSSFELSGYKNLFQIKTKELEKLINEEREVEISSATIKKEKELTHLNIKEIEKEINLKEQTKQKLIETSEFENWVSSSFLSLINFTEKNIMLKLREEFSKLFNQWFNILVPEIFTVRLDEDFTPIIEQQDFQLDYSFLSGGERTAVALAYRLALNQIINSLLSRIKTKDLVILDEPTDGFSEQQLDKMRDVLNELKVKQLIIVSHEPKIESFVEKIIKFKKEDGVSRIE